MSTYVPDWVKLDNKRFPRVKIRQGQKLQMQDSISPFNSQITDADSRAFQALMRHIKTFDSEIGTVIMVQVENEVGLLGDSRDRSTIAESIFRSPPDHEFIDGLRRIWNKSGPKLKRSLHHFAARSFQPGCSWEDTFGSGPEIDALFMAAHYAKHVERVAKAGKEIYPLPLYTNAWQPAVGSGSSAVAGGDVPGGFPSGGPIPEVIDVWRLLAPCLDFVCPDIYYGDFDQICEDYRFSKQPLFIPEQRRDEYGAIRLWSAIGNFDALGVSPFGIDTDNPLTSPYTLHYELLARVEPSIHEARQKGCEMYGFYFDQLDKEKSDPTASKNIVMGAWRLSISRATVYGQPSAGYGLVILQTDNTFLLIGEGFEIRFVSTGASSLCSILSFDELDVEGNSLVRRRRLNGDETMRRDGTVARMPWSKPDYGDFPICISIPSRTKIAQCTPYALYDLE
jgi:hypothetical protein